MASLFHAGAGFSTYSASLFLAHALVGPMHAPLISGSDIILLLLTAGISRRLSGLHALKLYGSNLFVLKHAAITAIILVVFIFFTPFLWQAQNGLETLVVFAIILTFIASVVRLISAGTMDVLQRQSLNLESVVIYGYRVQGSS